MTSDSVPVRRCLVGAVLRDHRETAGYTLEDAAEILGCDRSKISRIETGQRGISPRELRELLAEYGGDDQEQQAIIEQDTGYADLAFLLISSNGVFRACRLRMARRALRSRGRGGRDWPGPRRVAGCLA
jgi:transcriptional regulator with XRE-family HTH domain